MESRRQPPRGSGCAANALRRAALDGEQPAFVDAACAAREFLDVQRPVHPPELAGAQFGGDDAERARGRKLRERVGHAEDDALGRGHGAVETVEAAGGVGVGVVTGFVIAGIGGGRGVAEIAAERCEHATGLIDGLQLARGRGDERGEFAHPADPDRARRIDHQSARRATVRQRNQASDRTVEFEHAEIVRRVNVARDRVLLDAPVDR